MKNESKPSRVANPRPAQPTAIATTIKCFDEFCSDSTDSTNSLDGTGPSASPYHPGAEQRQTVSQRKRLIPHLTFGFILKRLHIHTHTSHGSHIKSGEWPRQLNHSPMITIITVKIMIVINNHFGAEISHQV